MVPLQPMTLETKLFFLSAAEFGGRLFRGPGGPGGADRLEWLEIVTMAPAELVNMLPDERAAAGSDPDYALPVLLARLTALPQETMGRDLHREFDRLFATDAPGHAASPATAGRLSTECEILTALLAKGFFGKGPDAAAKAKALCRDSLVPLLSGLRDDLARRDATGVFAASAVVMLAVTGDLAAKL